MRAEMGSDARFYPCEIGHQKPEAGFYSHVESALGANGDEILFWDDGEENVMAARRMGWQAKVYHC